MLPREHTEAFTVERGSLIVTDDGIKLWRVLFFGQPVGYTRRPGQEVAELNEKYRISQQKRKVTK